MKIRKSIKFYRCNVAFIEYDEVYVEARNKKEAKSLVKDQIDGEIDSISIEPITEQEYQEYA